MTIHSIFIVNKAGGLTFQKCISNRQNMCDGNDYLVIASTLQSISAISAQTSPVPNSSYIETIEANTINMHCFQTPTHLKFILVTDHLQTNTKQILAKIYELYSDYVLKNPFYIQDMPIKCEEFISKLFSYLQSMQT